MLAVESSSGGWNRPSLDPDTTKTRGEAMRTTPRSAPALAAIGLALALPFAGCGSDDSDEPSALPRSTEGGRSVTILETEYKLTPSNPTVKAGTVSFEVRNRGGVPHSLEVEGPSGEVETETLQPGQSETIRVDLSEPGRYEMYCPIDNHTELGMEGEVIVGDAGSGSDAGSGDDSGGGSESGGSVY
jgi:plastocyanin